MEKIPLPTNITIEEIHKNVHAKVIIEPCFPGHGTTLANALRRNLLSTLPGAAVTAFKIEGVQHEFSTIDGVAEDVVEISLNLKKLRLKLFSEHPVRLELKAKGEKTVKAKDITKNSDVEIINKDLTIATLTDKKAQLNMEIIVQQGRGYVPTEAREKEELELDMIAIDSHFSPIVRVGYKVENVRVGQMTNWDKIILDIETDGTITPQEAVRCAAEDLISHFQTICQKINEKTSQKKKTEQEETLSEQKEEQEASTEEKLQK